MAIKKTKNGTYQLKIYVPSDVQGKLGLGNIMKNVLNKREAREAELKFAVNIEKARNNLPVDKKEEITFKNFYKQIWLEPYKAGQTTTTIKPPTKATVFQTENLFRLHILPILGKYSIEYLNNNKQTYSFTTHSQSK